MALHMAHQVFVDLQIAGIESRFNFVFFVFEHLEPKVKFGMAHNSWQARMQKKNILPNIDIIDIELGARIKSSGVDLTHGEVTVEMPARHHEALIRLEFEG